MTRQLAMFSSRDGPDANRASAASVIAASGMWLQSSVIGASGKRPRRTVSACGSASIVAPIARTASTKAMSPWIESLPTPSMRSGASRAAIAPAAMKYDADEASPSTTKRPGERRPSGADTWKRRQPSRATTTPKRSSRRKVMSTYGFEISSPATSIDRAGAAGTLRQGEQQRGEELARDVAADDDRPVEVERRRRGATTSGGKPGCSR